MIGTLSVSAATYFHWNDKFKEEHKVTPEIEQKLNESNTAREINLQSMTAYVSKPFSLLRTALPPLSS